MTTKKKINVSINFTFCFSDGLKRMSDEWRLMRFCFGLVPHSSFMVSSLNQTTQ